MGNSLWFVKPKILCGLWRGGSHKGERDGTRPAKGMRSDVCTAEVRSEAGILHATIAASSVSSGPGLLLPLPVADGHRMVPVEVTWPPEQLR